MKRSMRWTGGLSALMMLLMTTPVATAQSVAPATPSPYPPARIFILPFTDPPGPNTWYVGQLYGNTVNAYFQRYGMYRAGQGMHFGVDFIAPCGTPLVAIGDGVVTAVDAAWHGAMPHNLMIQLDAGYGVLYGHLLERPRLNVGQRVAQGQFVALSGDSYDTCHSAPHLHLEIRSADYKIAYNPILFIEADWDSLALVGPYSHGFARDLTNPRRWQYPTDQPETRFGGMLLNEYFQPWPPDWR